MHEMGHDAMADDALLAEDRDGALSADRDGDAFDGALGRLEERVDSLIDALRAVREERDGFRAALAESDRRAGALQAEAAEAVSLRETVLRLTAAQAARDEERARLTRRLETLLGRLEPFGLE